MRIYLDSCILQDLKNPEDKQLLDLINKNKELNLYCFSEAHLYDLSRDPGQYKYDDMSFIETIVNNNCFSYDKGIKYRLLTPKEYYEDYDWSNIKDLDFDKAIAFLKAYPLQLSSIIETEELPDDFPDDYRDLLLSTTNFYDFIVGFLDFTENLTEQQKRFKKLLQYLHRNSLSQKVYESIEIHGYDGFVVFDKEKFRKSFTDFFIKRSSSKYRYQVFIDMFCGLDVFGIIKGKPRKQKLPNLINDGRHAFFGAFCDIVVTKDDDFINKAKFIYDLNDIKTLVLNKNEFREYLLNYLNNDSYKELKSELDSMKSEPVLHNWADKDIEFYQKRLKNLYFNYFNAVTFAISDEKSYLYFTKIKNNLSNEVMTKELESVTNILVQQLGKDINDKASFDISELGNEKWIGRNWQYGEMILHLNFNDAIYLMLFSKTHIINED